MVTQDVIDFSRDFHAEIHAEAHALEALREEIFVQKMGDILEDYGEIETLVLSPYQGSGMKVDGYCYDDEFKDLTLVISHYLDASEVGQAKVTNSDIAREFKRGITFFERSLKGLYNKIEISRESYDLARLIYECRDEIRNVRLVLLTDGITQKRSAEIEESNGIEISRTIWDIERVCHFHRTGERERIAVDFSKYCDGPLPCVIQENVDNCYTTYLGFIPGSALADMYALWGIKMLDMNVRVFLSARGDVNKGIRRTIIDEPEMFCTYNNGITVFARNVRTVSTANGIGLLGADDFQIINGGQTTASLYHTRKKDKADLSRTSVQMKLTVIHEEDDVPKLIPKISRFSNTQNKVQLADLAANESPHPEIQAVSNSILAPDPTGGSQQTYWFYERSRGSYEEFRNLTAKTAAQKKHFDFMRPKKQKFDKIKFAKAWNAYLRLPHLVSLGGQKNFGRFNDWLKDQKEEDWVSFFRKTVALLIMWNDTERLVRRQKFQGYHHNIVAYCLAWLFNLTDCRIDLEKIWQKQTTGEAVLALLEKMTHKVDKHIRDTSLNVTEYCKKVECWNELKNLHCSVPAEIQAEYVAEESRVIYQSRTSNEAAALEFCKGKGFQSWMELASWLKQRDFLTPKARSQCFNMGRALQRGKEPSIVLSIACKKAWEDAEIRGWNDQAIQTE